LPSVGRRSGILGTRRRIAYCIVALAGLSQLAVWGLMHWHWRGFASFHPVDPHGLQVALWQVEAAIATVALPIYLVIIQLSGNGADDDVALVSIPEVLRKNTWAEPVLAFSAVSLFRAGVDSLFFKGSAVLIFDFVTIFLATIVVLGASFWKLFVLGSSKAELRELSLQLVELKLDDATDELWVTSQANGLLGEDLQVPSRFRMRLLPFASALVTDEEWLILRSDELRRLRDVDTAGLRWAVDQLSAREPDPAAEPVEDGPELPEDDNGGIGDVLVMAQCELVVSFGAPVLAFRRAAFGELDGEALQRAFDPFFDWAQTP
jgi:hypothetical protein